MQSLMTEEKQKLKRVTGGKYHRSSLVFHFEKDDLNHEFQIKRIHSNSFNLRLVQPLRKYLKNRQMYTTFIIQMWSYCYFGIQRLRSKLCPEYFVFSGEIITDSKARDIQNFTIYRSGLELPTPDLTDVPSFQDKIIKYEIIAVF